MYTYIIYIYICDICIYIHVFFYLSTCSKHSDFFNLVPTSASLSTLHAAPGNVAPGAVAPALPSAAAPGRSRRPSSRPNAPGPRNLGRSSSDIIGIIDGFHGWIPWMDLMDMDSYMIVMIVVDGYGWRWKISQLSCAPLTTWQMHDLMRSPPCRTARLEIWLLPGTDPHGNTWHMVPTRRVTCSTWHRGKLRSPGSSPPGLREERLEDFCIWTHFENGWKANAILTKPWPCDLMWHAPSEMWCNVCTCLPSLISLSQTTYSVIFAFETRPLESTLPYFMTKTVEVSLPSHRSEQMSVVSKRGSISLHSWHAKLRCEWHPFRSLHGQVCYARILVRQTDRQSGNKWYIYIYIPWYMYTYL